MSTIKPKTKTAYLITTDEPELEGIHADTLEEALVFTGRMIERLSSNDYFCGKYIYVNEYVLDGKNDGNAKKELFKAGYLIDKCEAI